MQLSQLGDNSNKYFEFYFKNYPKILRKNRHWQF